MGFICRIWSGREKRRQWFSNFGQIRHWTFQRRLVRRRTALQKVSRRQSKLVDKRAPPHLNSRMVPQQLYLDSRRQMLPISELCQNQRWSNQTPQIFWNADRFSLVRLGRPCQRRLAALLSQRFQPPSPQWTQIPRYLRQTIHRLPFVAWKRRSRRQVGLDVFNSRQKICRQRYNR